MTMIEKKKTGGPYPKDERVKRQNEVSRLHFEYGYSATKIAEMMKVNRNTINQDIKNLYSEIKEELKESNEDLILKQIVRLEAQRNRIVENLNKIKNKNYDVLENSTRYEKLLLDVDSKINAMLSKINSESTVKKSKEHKISQEQIKDLVLFLLVKHSKNSTIKEDEILCEILNLYQCEVVQAEKIISQMKCSGLENCKKFNGINFGYDLLEFALLRRYILVKDSFVTKIQALWILEHHFEHERSELVKKFKEKYGNQERWNDNTFEEYRKEKQKDEEKHAKTFSEIAVEALEELSDQKGIKKYIECINTFFGKDEKPQLEKLLDVEN